MELEAIPISSMGSGVQTVLCVLALLHFATSSSDDNARHVFIFEELERSLHPTLQRSMYNLLHSYAESCGHTFFLTTQSNVAIDFFAADDQCQVVRIRNDGDRSEIQQVSQSLEFCETVDELGIRPSDLFQTNFVIWVEGPSDRIYMIRWIELLTGGELIPGVHYSVLLIGGSCNSHYDASVPALIAAGEIPSLIATFRICKHAAIMHDSDGKTGDWHGSRLVDEVKTHGHGWLTHGRTVENYVPPRILKGICGDSAPARNEDAVKAIQRIDGWKSKTKVQIARKIAKQLTKCDIESDAELLKELQKTIGLIQKHNDMSSA